MHDARDVLATTRPSFLVLTPACVLLGLATAVWSCGEASPVLFGLALLGALGAHASVNAFNEYSDFRSGLDTMTRRTPFSGGSGTLPRRPELARATLVVAVVALAMAAGVGVFTAIVRGVAVMPLVVVGLLIVVAYTRWITCRPLPCLVAPGLGFGLMVVGTHFLLTGAWSWTAVAAAAVPFFVVSDLLLLNQLPDVDADRRVGRRHLPITRGRRASLRVFAGFVLAAVASIGIAVATGRLPPECLVALVAFVPAGPITIGASRHADMPDRLLPFLGWNVLMAVLAPVLLAVGLFVA